jgi:NTP pyrophosphatase (non-canonical NTP hydrolase)
MPSETVVTDAQITIRDLRLAVHTFVAERDWHQYHAPKNLAMSIAIEAAEIMEHFQWYTAEESAAHLEDPEHKAAVADELADVLIYCLSFANSTGIDISQAVLQKLAYNQTRFPIEAVRGRLGSE